MSGSLSLFGSSDLFMPHGHCYLWQPGLVWLQVIANGAIALAYVSIFLTLVYLVRRIRDIPFQWMYVAFAIFIVACGVTHIFDVLVIWEPVYWTDGAVRAVTAFASVGTALLMPPLVPKALALAEAAAMSHQRGIDLETANRELGVLLDRTKELEELKTQFFANVSHELRTPLALILGPAEQLARAENLSEEQRRSLGTVLRNARSLLRQVNDLLDVAKLEAGRTDPEYRDTDVARLVRLTASQFESLAEERKISFEVDAEGTLRTQVDADKLQRIVLNLLSNAYKFTPDGGSIRCSLARRAIEDREHIHIEVGDSGPGIAPRDRGAIFERFRQLEGGTTRRFGGTGLGLTIAKQFVELHGGQIAVADAPEGGALFSVDLPFRAPAERELERESITEVSIARHMVEELRPREVSAVTEGSGASLVLVVEDNPEMSAFLVQTLGQEHRVAAAPNGLEGLKLARTLQPDLVITDIMMPEMSGDALVRAMSAEPALARIPVMVLSAKADDELRVELLREGAQDYLLKPFSAEEVRARSHNLVTIKRARDVLEADLETKSSDLEVLARAMSNRQRELSTAMDSLRIARDQALKASEAKTNFLSMVSHELRTPLTAVRLQIDRLAREFDDKESERKVASLAKLDRAGQRLEHIVESLLDYARLQSGKLDVRLERTDLVEVVEEAVDEIRTLSEQKQLDLELTVDKAPLVIETDPRILHIILVNLLGNAVKFTDQGKVSVHVSESDGVARVAVKDTGPGIPVHEHARIFEPFEQLEEVRRKHTPGLGLGLALVRELAQALAGRVQVQSEPGLGSTFTMVLSRENTLAEV